MPGPSLLKFAAKLYPAWWRRRYGSELTALLEDSKPRLRDVVDILKGAIEMHMSFGTRAGIAVACGLFGAMLTFGASFLMQPKYESTATLAARGEDLAQQFTRVPQVSIRSRSVLTGIIAARGLYKRERNSRTTADLINQMNRSILLIPSTRHVLKVSFTYEDAALAQQVTQDLAAGLMSTDSGLHLESLDPPSPPRRVSPARANMAIFGLGAGLLLGLVLLVILPSPQRLKPA